MVSLASQQCLPGDGENTGLSTEMSCRHIKPGLTSKGSSARLLVAGPPFKAFFKPAENVLTRHEKGPTETKGKHQAWEDELDYFQRQAHWSED